MKIGKSIAKGCRNDTEIAENARSILSQIASGRSEIAIEFNKLDKSIRDAAIGFLKNMVQWQIRVERLKEKNADSESKHV